jgi:hypothetical protein
LLSCEYSNSSGTKKVSKRDQYGLESIDQLVDMLSELKGLVCVIVAGYQEEMETCFLSTNPGLDRRFPHKWLLKRSSVQDMLRLFVKILQQIDGVMVSGKRIDTVFKGSRKVFSPGFKASYITSRMELLIHALDYLNAFPNQSGDVETLARILYGYLSMHPSKKDISDQELVSVVQEYLTGKKSKVISFSSSDSTVQVVDQDGKDTVLRS